MTDPLIDLTARKRRLSHKDFEPEDITWRSYGRVALGKITVLDGDPGLGKSTITLDWAAAETRGWVYCDPAPIKERKRVNEPRGVVLLVAEDGIADTVRPRFEAAGGDPDKVLVLDMARTEYRSTAEGMEEVVTPYPIQIPDDLTILRDAMDEIDAGLVLADPLITFLTADSTKDQEVRHALSPFAQALDMQGRYRTGKTACVALRHQTKGSLGGPSLYRGGGSIGIVALARIGLVVGKDPHDPTGQTRALATNKVNNAQEVESIGYTLEPSETNASIATVNWTGPSEHTAESLGRAPLSPEDATELAECREWLEPYLQREHNGVVIAQVFKDAQREGFGKTIVEKARHALGAVRWKTPDGEATWRLR